MHPVSGDDTGDQASGGNWGFRGAITELLEHYGWFILIGIGICVYLWRAYMAAWFASRNEGHATLLLKKNDDVSTILSRHEAIAAARQRMQEEQNRLSVLAKEREAKLEEEKRKQKIEDWERQKHGGSNRSGTSAPEEQPSSSSTVLRKKDGRKPLRPNDYNPLSGSGGGSSYRPNRRCFPSGGG